MKTLATFLVCVISFITCGVCHADFSEAELYASVEEGRLQMIQLSGPYVADYRVSKLVEDMHIDVPVLVRKSEHGELAFYYPGVIILGGQVLDESDESLAFIIAHEYGHHIEAHWKQVVSRAFAVSSAEHVTHADLSAFTRYMGSVQTAEIQHRSEFEADAAGARIARAGGHYDQDKVSDFFKRHAQAASGSHPETTARFERIVAELRR